MCYWFSSSEFSSPFMWVNAYLMKRLGPKLFVHLFWIPDVINSIYTWNMSREVWMCAMSVYDCTCKGSVILIDLQYTTLSSFSVGILYVLIWRLSFYVIEKWMNVLSSFCTFMNIIFTRFEQCLREGGICFVRTFCWVWTMLGQLGLVVYGQLVVWRLYKPTFDGRTPDNTWTTMGN